MLRNHNIGEQHYTSWLLANVTRYCDVTYVAPTLNEELNWVIDGGISCHTMHLVK